MNPLEIASALSHSPVDGPPDAPLWNAAKAGPLTLADSRAHVRRLIAPVDANAAPTSVERKTLARFFVEYLRYDYAEEVPKNPKKYPGLEKDTAGVLTQPSLMIALSHPDSTHPVRRGKFMREAFLCQNPPSLPIEKVPPLPDLGPYAPERAKLAEHTKGTCVACCHQSMDPIGPGPHRRVFPRTWVATPVRKTSSTPLVPMARIALGCGLTNVMGITMNTGHTHATFRQFMRIHKGTKWESLLSQTDLGGFQDNGHSVTEHGATMNLIVDYLMGHIASMYKMWSSMPEGGGTVADNTVLVFSSDAGEHHHGNCERFPMVIIGDVGGKLKADGRSVRYPAKPGAGYRGLCHMWSTLAHAVGAPIDNFGEGGSEPAKGPLPELLG